MLSSQYNTNQSENRPMMSSVVDNGGGESEFDKNKKLRNSKTSNNFIKKNIQQATKDKKKNINTPRESISYGKMNKEMQVLRNNLNNIKKERDEKVYN
jgi:hypothetical protein